MQSETLTSPSDEEVVKKLCMVNGVSYEKIVQEGSSITSLEVFFSGFPRMVGLSFFQMLSQLTIVDQSITHIQGLECCPLLKELWIVQCHLKEICGLQNCLQLEKLYLYDNQISEIKTLKLLVNLEVLWLNNNLITRITGLNTLRNLKDLNLADNAIEKIGDSLHPHGSLHHLNLSGNKITSFKELTLLAHLSNLRELTLQDRTSVPNPVCQLYNYATHVLYHMPDLQRLDNYDVSNRLIKEAAESAVRKKKMYYNMRVCTARRDLAEIQASLKAKNKALLQLPKERIKALCDTLKSLEHELSMVQRGCKNSACIVEENPRGSPHLGEGSTETCDSTSDTIQDPDMEPKTVLKIEALKDRLRVWTSRLDEIEAQCERELAQQKSRMEYTVQFLLMELESVGNIRLEEGNSTDPWVSSCSDLLLSRFAPAEYEDYGIVDIKINRIIRIHNNALRLRFEEKHHSLIAKDSSQNYRHHLDYLFYMPDPEKSEKEETLCILEEGFKTAEQPQALGGESAVALSNNLMVTDQPRIEHTLSQAGQSDTKKKGAETILFSHGQVIVSKVFVGKSRPLREGETLSRRSLSKVCSVYRSLETRPRSAVSTEGSCPTKTHQWTPYGKQWFVFEPELVLPEYIINFEYITTDRAPTDRETSLSSDVTLDNEVLNMDPVLKPRPKRLSLNKDFLLTVAGANFLSQITVLNLHSNSLTTMKEITVLKALRHLTISCNRLTRLDDITHMPHLEFLDVSFNQLVTLGGLQGLAQLKQLDVQWNELTKARHDAAVLRKHTPALLQLDTRYNPWNRSRSVRMTMLGRLPTLTHLDGELVSEEETAEALQMTAECKINQASLLAHSRTDGHRPRTLSLLSTAQLLSDLSPAPWSLYQELEPDWAEKVTTLNLDNLMITHMVSLIKLVNLRWASFNDNEISKVEGLDGCLKLEELSLNNNCISTLSGLTRLHGLHRLSMDGNQLSSLDASALDLPNLSFLSLENNCLTSLHGIQRLRSLLELYIGDNRISTSRDIFYLKGLTYLIILDLYGNPLVEKLENYRINVVFHLSSLKALDGVAVEPKETESAKIMFKGRLTTDTVAEKLGHSNYTAVTYLTLQSCSFRTVGLSPPEAFRNLRSVNLDHNNLTSFSGLISLPNIKALSLNYNHIESILPKQKTHLTNRQKLYSKVASSGYGQLSLSKGSRDAVATGGLEPLMESLEVLHLCHNGIANMANLQLSRLTNLKALFLEGNEISHVEGLERLCQLRELVLDRNRIKVLSKNSFTSQGRLLELHLAENRICELNHLDSLTELRSLFLDINKLQDVAELEKLEVLPSLAELSVVGNPVARNSLYRPAVVLRLCQLQVLDGENVTLEERARAELPPEPDQSLCPLQLRATLPATEINLPGLSSLTLHNTALRGMNMSTGVLSIPPASVADDHHTYKFKKDNYCTAARRGQTSRRTGSNLPTTSLRSNGNRVTHTYSKQQQDHRHSSDGGPSPM